MSSERFKKTIASLEENQINTIIPLHCTGMEATAKLYQAFPDKVKFLSVGDSYSFNL
jgi:metal-dependent hydrolase (beta-lactamase superfamily II)